MAIVKTLIVKGVARFLTDAYMSTIRSGIWNGSTIQVGYGGTGVTSAKGSLYTPVFLSSSGIAPCSVEIPHATKDFKINGVTYAVFTNSTGTAPTIFAPTGLASTGGYILATNSAKTGLEWVAANNHTHSLYVLLDSGTTEQTIKSSISSLSNGVIELWRAVASGYPMIGFANGTTKTHLGKLGFGSEANKPIFRNTSNTDYLLAHAGNIVNNNITVALNTEKTIATIAGVAIKLKVTGTNNVTTTAVVAAAADGTTQISSAQSNPFYNLLEGGAVTRSIQFTSSNITISSTTGGVISFTAKSWAGATSSAAGTAGYMPGAASADRGKYLRGDGTWVALAPSISAETATNTVKITVGGENSSNFTIPYASLSSGAEYLNGYNISTLSDAKLDSKVKWFTKIVSTESGTAGYANDNTGFPTANNANGILWLGTHSGNFGGLVGISSNGNLYYRFISNGNFPTNANGGSWKRIAFTSDLSNTWRNIYTGGTSRVGTGTSTKAMNFAVAGNLSVNYLAAGTGSGQSGSADYFTVKITANANAVGVAGYVAAPTKASNPNQVWMTNSDGEPAWRTINVSTAATLLAKISKSLKVDTWTDMGAVSTYTGTYAIQISSGNVMASGIFTACGGTDSVIDEIPLHVADKGTNTWRPYARISAGQLQMTTNEATGTSREYTIKILKLI